MVKCSDCGFLAVRNTESQELEEADETFRERGVVPTTGRAEGLTRMRSEQLPLCFTRCHDLREEFRVIYDGKEKSVHAGVHQVIIKERECGESFTKWQQGFTPKEHREMLDRAEWLKWQEHQRKEDKRWRIIELIVIVLVTVIFAGIFTILGAFIERGSLFP